MSTDIHNDHHKSPPLSPLERTGTIEEKIQLLNKNNIQLRIDNFSKGIPFMIFLSDTPTHYYYEYPDGRIEVRTLGDKNKTILQTLTGTDADQIRKQAGIFP